MGENRDEKNKENERHEYFETNGKMMKQKKHAMDKTANIQNTEKNGEWKENGS